MVKKFILLLLLITLYPIFFVHSQNEPIISVPYEVNNYINLSNPNSFGIYKVILINPLNETVYFSFSTLSPLWYVEFGNNNQYQYGMLGPDQTLEVLLYLRPYEMTNEVCDIVLEYEYNNRTPIVSYTLQISPIIYYQVSNNISNIYAYMYISNSELYQGQNEYVYIDAINNNSYPLNATLYLYTQWGYYNESELLVQPGNNTFVESFQIPYDLYPGQYNVTIIFDNITEEVFNIYVLPSENIQPKSPQIIYKNNEILIYNPNNFSIEFEYILNISKNLLPFYFVEPKPQQVLYNNQNLEFMYYIYLPPYGYYIIRILPNYILISAITFIIAIIIILILFIFFIPIVDIKKKIIKYDIKSRTFTISINIKNKSFLPIYNVRVEDIISKDLEIINYETVEPIRIYKEENTRIVWNFERIDKNGEVIISYTIKVPENINSFNIQPCNMRFEFTFRSIEKKSNGLRISFI